MSGADAGYRFLSGAAMEPRAILIGYPGARFVARARLPAGGAGTAGAPAGDIWGIVIRLASPDPDGAGDEREVTTDDGRVLVTAVSDGGRPPGDAAAVLAAAKYWELPPAYVKSLPTG